MDDPLQGRPRVRPRLYAVSDASAFLAFAPGITFGRWCPLALGPQVRTSFLFALPLPPSGESARLSLADLHYHNPTEKNIYEDEKHHQNIAEIADGLTRETLIGESHPLRKILKTNFINVEAKQIGECRRLRKLL